MRKEACFILLLSLTTALNAQKYDYHWILGNYFRNSELFFTENSVDTMFHPRGVDMNNTQTTISDSSGGLLFYTNGAKVYTRHDSIMSNGDSLNYGYLWENEGGLSYPCMEGIVGLPTTQVSIWNLLHYYIEDNINNDPVEYTWRIYQTKVDMSKNNTLGTVLFKNKTIIQDTMGSYVTACKHGNGRDWWVLVSKTSSNCLYTLLVQDDTIIQYPLQCIGINYTDADAGQAVFSPDGTKFAWLGSIQGVNLFDFDRCTGQLSNPVHLPLQITGPPYIVLEYGLAFSPNSRFLYAAQTKNIFQFDTQAPDVWASMDTVGYYQPPPDSGFPGTYFLMELAPNGKIYISATNGIRYLHVINEPDKKGDSCHFVNYGLRLPSYNSFGLPNYPNYRLGALTGSACDTLGTAINDIQAQKEKEIKVFPNPANAFVIIDYGFTDWSKGEVSLQISNELGQVVYAQKLPMYSGFQRIDISKFPVGFYTAFIQRNNSVVATSKFVKE